MRKKGDYFFYDFDTFDGSIGCAIKFYADKLYFFSISVRSKVINLIVSQLHYQPD